MRLVLWVPTSQPPLTRRRAAPPQGVRVLRARNLIRQPVSTPTKVREEPQTKGFSRLSPLALRMLVRRPRDLSPSRTARTRMAIHKTLLSTTPLRIPPSAISASSAPLAHLTHQPLNAPGGVSDCTRRLARGGETQIRTNPFPHLLVDVRDAAAAAARPLPADMAGAVQLPGAVHRPPVQSSSLSCSHHAARLRQAAACSAPKTLAPAHSRMQSRCWSSQCTTAAATTPYDPRAWLDGGAR
jgi:hypothetical protein